MKNKSVSVRPLFVTELFLTLLCAGAGAGGCGGKPDTPPLGVTHAAVTAEGIGLELTQQGDIIAKVTHPFGGGGSKKLEVIRDGQKPSADDEPDSLNQYDTFDNTTPNEAKTDDWIGYQYLGDVTFGRVWFLEGMNFDDGGWFTTLNVQVRHAGVWTAVTSLAVSPPYQPNDGHSYDSYQLDFAPITGDAIRIEGAPGGSARFISVAELQVWAAPGTSSAPAAAPLGADITGPGTPIAKITQPLGGGSKDLRIIKNTSTPVVGTGDSSSAALQYDTYTGDLTRTEDWIGYAYDSTQFFGQLVLQVGMRFPDGGWFETLDVQVRQNGNWVPVSSLNITPSYPTDGSSPDFKAYQLDFIPVGGDGIRVIGRPGGTSRFISVASLRVLAGNPCQGKTNGTDCSDGDICTVGDRCFAELCQPMKPYDCAAPDDACRGRGVCQRATGTCTRPVAADGVACDDGNRCTTNDQCSHGTCIPGSVAPACTGPNATFYAPVTNLGSFQGQSVAMDINEQGMVVGNDSPGHDNETVVWRGGQGVAQAFRWTEAEGMTYAPSVGAVNIALGTNASGDIAGVGGPFRSYLNVLRSNRASGTSDLLLTQAGGAAINDAGEIAGWGYFPGQPNVRMFRMSDGQPEVISPPEGSGLTGVSAPKAIDSQGNMVGYVTDADSANGLAALVRQGTVTVLNELLFDSPLDPDHLWNLTEADAIHFDEATGTDTIVGWGIYAGVPHAFELILQGGTVPQLVDLKTLSPYDEPTSYIHIPIPRDINSHGEVVGSFHDLHGAWPTVPFVYVPYAPNQRMIKLNDLIDPESGWTLSAAFGINDNREVVGFGYLNGEARAYRMKLPDMTPCPGSDGLCHSVPVRDPTTGICSTSQVLADNTPCDDGLACTAGDRCLSGVCRASESGACRPTDVPEGNLVPTVNCVIYRNTVLTAIFGYLNLSGRNLHLPVGSEDVTNNAANFLSLDNGIIHDPRPAPPDWFRTGTTKGAFQASYETASISWTLGATTVTADRESPACNWDPVTAIVDLGDGNTLDLTKTPTDFKHAPAEPPMAADPDVGDPYFGALKGTLSVSPSGASIYTVPISIPPGIASAAPDLNLVYSSQGGDGIAGQGWALTGASIIHRCPKTRIQDGRSRAVLLDDGDGICLDGARLFDRGDGSFEGESKDFGTVAMLGGPLGPSSIFKVVTKTNQTHYYGSRTNSRAVVGPPGAQVTVAWMLDRVVDSSGNYFELHYNLDEADSNPDTFRTKGILITSIAYTGHTSGLEYDESGRVTAVGDDPPFHTITFTYEPRDDVRFARFGTAQIPTLSRLKTINTPLGTYSLTYDSDPSVLLPSRLSNIDYCLDHDPLPGLPSSRSFRCLDGLSFTWDKGGYRWAEENDPRTANSGGWENNYPVPGTLAPQNLADGPYYPGTQFVDLDGDGRPDFVRGRWDDGRKAYRNNGHGWTEMPNWALPVPLIDLNKKETWARFADFDGDGLPDMIGPENPGPICNVVNGSQTCVTGPFSPAVWLNKIKEGRGWVASAEYSFPSSAHNSLAPQFVQVVDLNGDGRADYVTKDIQGNGTDDDPFHTVVTTYYNTQHAWAPWPNNIDVSQLSGDLNFVDVNRDGLVDIILNNKPSGGSGSPRYTVQMNLGPDHVGFDGFPGPVQWATTQYPGEPPQNAPVSHRYFGDIDGDHLVDPVIYNPPKVETTYTLNNDDGTCRSCSRSITLTQPKVSFGTGYGYSDAAAGNFLATLGDFSATFPPTCDCSDGDVFQNYFMAAGDLNGDGLMDVVLNRQLAGGAEAGQLLVNTGAEWKDLNGRKKFTSDPGPGPVPVTPSDQKGSIFIDLDGDGVSDLLQSIYVGTTATNTQWVTRAWLNKFQPPIIKGFPNGQATASTVDYQVITSADGSDPLSGAYSDEAGLAPGTTYAAAPLRVVSAVHKENGRGTGERGTTTYKYSSLRGSAAGRGALGFRTVTMHDEASDETTITTYAQGYPFTGMATSVEKLIGSTTMTKTTTMYCHQPTPANHIEHCSNDSPVNGDGSYPPRQSLFVYPRKIVDVANVWGQSVTPDTTTTTTVFQYDTTNGNPLSTIVTIENSLGEVHQKQVVNTFGTPGSIEEQRGKITRVVTTSSADAALAITHTTAFVYGAVGAFRPLKGEPMQDTLGLKETIVEPGAGSDPTLDQDRPNVLETHTAFAYDRFGHVTTTTECASHYRDCSPGAVGPTDAFDANAPRFRTTRVSYDPQHFSVTAPSDGGGDEEFFITTGLSYTRGRFPVRTIDPEGHASYSAFDPSTGMLIQETDPNGIFTCHKYDGFSNPIAVAARCGTQQPLITRTQTHHSPPALVATRPFVTVSKSSAGDAKWTYSDVLGRSRETLVRGFAGGFVHSGVVTYDPLGRVETETAPYLDTDGSPKSITRYTYGSLNRLHNVAGDLGALGPNIPHATSSVTTFYQGFSICTERVVKGRTQVRLETKNALGKIASITTLMDYGNSAGPAQTCAKHKDYGPGSLQAQISYVYDADGNLTSVTDDAGNVTGLGYDVRGRKTSVNDPDMGGWTYSYDGFGQLISQTDAKLQKTMLVYDRLGRPLRKGPKGGTQAEWVYDTAPGKGIGRLAAMVSRPDARLKLPCAIPGTSQTDGNRSGRSFRYDDLGAVSNVSECTDGDTFDTSFDYDTQGRTSIITYPAVAGNRLAVGYHYTATNRLQYVFDLADSSDSSVLWSATAVNALGQIVKETTRNGVETVSQRNPVTGWLLGATSTAYLDGSTLIQDRSYGYDEAGNLQTRTRSEPLNGPVTAETFDYDAADRLTNAFTTIAANGYVASDTYGYDNIGNLTKKGGKNYSYGSCQNAGPHAICPTDVGDAFSYDLNGNMTSGHGRTATYGAANKALYVTKDTAGIDFVYGADDQRVVQEVGTTNNAGPTERTIYVGLGATGKSLYERTTKSSTGTTEHVHFIYAGSAHGGNAFALRTVTTSTNTSSPNMAVPTTVSTRYYHADHLGSVIAWSDEVGHVSAPAPDAPTSTTLSYDPWGARRTTDGRTLATPAAAAALPSPPGHREFTGHEVIPGVGLVNMNGRIYDPELGRFLSPDPNVQFVADLQSYNRYSYVLNNPLRSTDPTGYKASSVLKGFLNSFPNPYSDPFYNDPSGIGWWTSNPERSVKTFMTVGTAVVGAVACAYSGGAGCVAAMAMIAAINANMMIGEGASVKQTLIVTGISIVASGFGGAAAGATTGMTHAMIQGAVSGAMSAAITGIAFHQRDLGANILVGAIQGAMMAALTTGLTRAIPMSRAEVAAQGGGDQAWGGWGNRDAYEISKFELEASQFLASAGPSSPWCKSR